MVKNPPTSAGDTRNLSLISGLERSPRGEVAWEIPWSKEPGGLQSMGSQRVRHNWATEHARTSYLRDHSPPFSKRYLPWKYTYFLVFLDDQKAISTGTLSHQSRSYCLKLNHIHIGLDGNPSLEPTLCVNGGFSVVWGWRFGKCILEIFVRMFLEFWLPTVNINKFSTSACQNGVGL